MNHLTTIFINTPKDTTIVNPNRSHCIRLDLMNSHAYAPLVCKLSEAFIKAQISFEEKMSSDPYEVSIVYKWVDKFKPEDPEDNFKRICWIIENMKPPQGGIKISIYQNSNMDNWIIESWTLRHMWETKQIWSKDALTEKYITVHKPEPLSIQNWNRVNIEECFEKVNTLADQYRFEVKEISYSTPISEVYKLLLGSSMHFSYVGGSYFLSALTKTPTVGVGHFEKRINRIILPYPDGYSYPNYSYEYFSNVFCAMVSRPEHSLTLHEGKVVNDVPAETHIDTEKVSTIETQFKQMIANEEV